jgi:hypothetical protein
MWLRSKPISNGARCQSLDEWEPASSGAFFLRELAVLTHSSDVPIFLLKGRCEKKINHRVAKFVRLVRRIREVLNSGFLAASRFA